MKSGTKILLLILCLLIIAPVALTLSGNSNGNIINGSDGKSAYKYALEAGYVGSEKNFSVDLKNAVLNSDIFITPDMYGAVGDAYTDDSKAFQDCFDDSKGKIIVIPAKHYKLDTPIKLSEDIYSYNVIGGYVSKPYSVHESDYPKLYCSSHFIDGTKENGSAGKYNLNLDGLRVRLVYEDSEKNFLNNVIVEAGFIENCVVENPHNVLKGAIFARSIIQSCNFYGVKSTFITDADFAEGDTFVGSMDSTVRDCYINGAGNLGYNATLLDTSVFFNMNIDNCFIDFFKQAIVRPENGQADYRRSSFNNCIFDIMWRVVTGRINADIPLTFNSCVFESINETAVAKYFSNPDEEMYSDGGYTKCGVVVNDMSKVVNVDQNYLKNVSFIDCSFTKVDYPFYFSKNAWDHTNIIERGSTFSECKANVTFSAVVTPSTFGTMYFESLNGGSYDTLPLISDPTSTGGYRVECFEGMWIYYNGKIAICHNMQWVDTDGNVLE